MRSVAEIQQELEPVLRDIELWRTESVHQFSQIALWSAVIGGLLTLGLALAFQSGWSLVPLVIALIVILVAYAQRADEWRKAFKTRVMASLIKAVNPELNYHPQACITRAEYETSLLFHNAPDPDRYRGEDLIEGRVGQTDIRLSELHTEYKTVSYDSKGRRQEHWHTIFRGLFITADFHKDFHGITLVFPDPEQQLLGRFGQWLQGLSAKIGNQPGELVKLEDPEFERMFKVYSTDQIEARYILTPSLMARIVDFAKKTRASIRLSFVNSRLYLAIPTWHNYFEPPSLFAPAYTLAKSETLQRYLAELAFALSVVDELNLNTRIWGKR
ncbi:Protein of unknown function (DUF3137) [Armatimonadetes bacterium GXS]|nr:Protein of unknown function (DUF3137) [Armatimonadetes bacterium GXS]